MPRQIALDNIYLRPAERWGHTEYSLEYHKEYLAQRLALHPEQADFTRRVYDHFEFDFIWNTHDGLVEWSEAGRVTEMGHAVYAADGSDWKEPVVSPFRSEQEVWAFDAVAEYGLPDFQEQVNAYDKLLIEAREKYPEQLFTGGYYKTIVSGAIAAFGWDMLLMAAANPARMEKVFDSIFRRTQFYMQVWAQTSAEVIIQHDDFVWTSGPFMRPDYYRQVIIPRYAELWKPLHAAGKKVLFCSDGNFMILAEDIVAAGADGLIFEPCNDFGFLTERFGDCQCLVGSFVDCRDLTFNNWDQVQADIERTFQALKRCKGAILAVGNHMPANIPHAMTDRYFEMILPRLVR